MIKRVCLLQVMQLSTHNMLPDFFVDARFRTGWYQHGDNEPSDSSNNGPFSTSGMQVKVSLPFDIIFIWLSIRSTPTRFVRVHFSLKSHNYGLEEKNDSFRFSPLFSSPYTLDPCIRTSCLGSPFDHFNNKWLRVVLRGRKNRTKRRAV